MDIQWLDWVIVLISGLLMLGGLVGCFLPIVPGPPLSYVGLLLLQLKVTPPYSANLMIWLAVIVVVVTVLDYAVPAWGTKRFGGSKYGVWGSIIGLIVGLFFLPMPLLGVIIGPFLGAFVGELIGGKETQPALRAAWGSFLGFLAGTALKVVVCLVLVVYYVWYGIV